MFFDLFGNRSSLIVRFMKFHIVVDDPILINLISVHINYYSGTQVLLILLLTIEQNSYFKVDFQLINFLQLLIIHSWHF